MRTACFLLLILFFASDAAARPSVAVTFAPPAQLRGETQAEGGQWLALFFGDQATGTIEVEAAGAEGQNRSIMTVDGSEEPFVAYQRTPVEMQPSDVVIPPEFRLAYATRFASLVIEADEIRVQAVGNTELHSQPTGVPIGEFVPNEVYATNPYWDWHVARDGPNVVQKGGAHDEQALSFEADGLRRLSWYGADVACSFSKCPDGGGVTVHRRQPTLSGSHALIEHSYIEASLLQGSAVGVANGAYVVLAGPIMEFSFDGELRLPLASFDDCETCMPLENQTLHATGQLHLTNASVSQDGRLQAEFDGQLQSARLDETIIDAASLFNPRVAVGASAVGVAILLLKWLITPLLTKKTPEVAFKHSRRRQLHDYIVAHPGIHFRGLIRATKIPSGSARHHLSQLLHSGILVERRVGSKLRLFAANVNNPDAQWQLTALDLESDLKNLHDWIQSHPGQTQTSILEAFQQMHAWSRSTTQARLARLLRIGLVSVRHMGRYKVYSAAQQSTTDLSSQPPPQLKAPQTPHLLPGSPARN
jgi:predicted transcriptional regulator